MESSYDKQCFKAKDYREAVDAVIEDGKGNVILIKRKYPPFLGMYALPGGFIEKNETPRQALLREVKEETNLHVKIKKIIGKYDKEGRDPRGRIVSTAFKCNIIGDLPELEFGDDASTVELVPIEKLNDLNLAFDHKDILKDASVLK